MSDNTFHRLDNLDVIAFNMGNAVGVVDRRATLFVNGVCYSPLIEPSQGGTHSDRILAPGEGRELTIADVLEMSEVDHFEEGGAEDCELRYRVRQPPSGEWDERSIHFTCGKGS
ncbi:MAG: hypothetical protein F4Y14_03230 [Acidobacteria bacterium]|nr:hypothetical protein [Acidobacteriota bacterium]